MNACHRGGRHLDPPVSLIRASALFSARDDDRVFGGATEGARASLPSVDGLAWEAVPFARRDYRGSRLCDATLPTRLTLTHQKLDRPRSLPKPEPRSIPCRELCRQRGGSGRVHDRPCKRCEKRRIRLSGFVGLGNGIGFWCQERGFSAQRWSCTRSGRAISSVG